MNVRTIDLQEWGDALPAEGYEVFHREEVLRVLDEYTDGKLVLFAGYTGEKRVAMLPIFLQQRSFGTVAFSPPPSMGVSRLGPILVPTSPKQRKREKLNSEFVQAVLDRLDIDTKLSLLRFVCGVGYDDPRQFGWRDLSVTPRFTYHLEVGDDPDAQLNSFSKSLRREIRDSRELDLSVSIEGRDAIEQIHDRTMSRYDEQDHGYELPWPYVRDLTDALGDRSRAYVARDDDGEFLAGITAIYSNDVAYFWQGGTRTVYENVSINSYLHWQIIQDVAAGDPVESVSTYDLMGANTERLCRYKAKFGGQVVPYFTVESDGAFMDLAKNVYQRLAH